MDGGRYYRVAHVDAMPPFFMTLVSDSDHWLFISSNGALTAGRRDPDHALFPYYPDDRIHDSRGQTGSRTILRVARDGGLHLWEPFSDRCDGDDRLTRTLYKSVEGDRIVFEEVNQDLGLAFRYAWTTSERFGFVRQSRLTNLRDGRARVELLDGIQNVLPDGLGRRFQLEFSTLGDGYKRTEHVPGTRLALFTLSAIPVDKAEPCEALRVNLAWSEGLPEATLLLSSDQLGAFCRGEALRGESDIRGRRGAYFLNTHLDLAGHGQVDWLMVAEVGQDALQVSALRQRLTSGVSLRAEVLEDVARGTRNLIRVVAAADGLQATGDPLSAGRHFSNTLFNVMRGGLPQDGYRVSMEDVRAFLADANVEVAGRHAQSLASLPEVLPRPDLVTRAAAWGDPDLDRLVREYLPLTFSRRHGDPSRPWNSFTIKVKDAEGRQILNYEGNWRDIFQNWEALGASFPGFLEGMIFKFLDASTADGHNPYRLTRGGYEWEVIDPHDPWSFIGYWGDHQVIYLLKLLEASERFQPGRLTPLLHHRVFTYAHVPYRIKPYPELLDHPRNTITFDGDLHRHLMAHAQGLGADGKALAGPDGPVRATLAEKLLLVALSKLANFVPEGGIWMNTQRPEWNDANNALVGYGMSVVTLCYLRRYLAFCGELLGGTSGAPLEVSREVADLFARIEAVLVGHRHLLEGPLSDLDRRRMLDGLGQAGSDHRQALYARGFSGEQVDLAPQRVQAFIRMALAHVDHTIRANRREDGLFHAYNLMRVTGEGIAVRHLYEMLEGQVAVLSSGLLTLEDAISLLDALRASRLYRSDQASYMLYPDRSLPGFLDKNVLPEEALAESELLRAQLEAGDRSLVARDAEGHVRFNAAFLNAEALRDALKALEGTRFADLAARERERVLNLYERVFDHQSFTGRSGTFYKYEGLGCIYWHMVSKLLLAVDEVLGQHADGDPRLVARLQAHYREIREGIGVHKAPEIYGAIPTDPYSHTPGFAGAQQPGMTGQVKEDILTRFSELGLRVSGGCIGIHPERIAAEEFLAEPTTFAFIDVEGQAAEIRLEPGSLALTLCQVPVVLHRRGERRLVLTEAGGSRTLPGLVLPPDPSRAIFERSGKIRRVDAFLGG